MYWILPLALISFFFLDQPGAHFISSLSYPKWPLRLLGLVFQPFIQFTFFLLAYLFASPNQIYNKMLVNCILTISIVTILKIVIARARPFIHELSSPNFKHFSLDFSYHSMPSSHACMSFALFLTLSGVYPKLYTPLLALSILVSLSRMLLGLHFLSDCLFGAFLGLLISSTSQKFLTIFLNIKKG